MALRSTRLTSDGYVRSGNSVLFYGFELIASTGNEASVVFYENGGSSGTAFWQSDTMIGADTNSREVFFPEPIEVQNDLYADLTNGTVSALYKVRP